MFWILMKMVCDFDDTVDDHDDPGVRDGNLIGPMQCERSGC